MARGYPDYANPLYSLAARNVDFSTLETMSLGIPSLDGLGRIAWWDNFREGLYGWTLSQVGDGAVPYVHNLQALIPPVSVRFPCGTLAGGGVSTINKSGVIAYPIAAGLDLSIASTNPASEVLLGVEYDDGVNKMTASLTYFTATGMVQFLTGGVLTTLATLSVPNLASTFQRFKLAVDFINATWKRVLIGQVSYDLAGYALTNAATAIPGRYQVTVQVTAKAASTPTVNLGHVLFTIDEP